MSAIDTRFDRSFAWQTSYPMQPLQNTLVQIFRTGRMGGFAWCLIAAGTITGCPDVDGNWERFIEETEDEREEIANQPDMGAGMLADISGDHLFAISAVLSPALPLQFVATVSADIGEDGGTLVISFQPLSLNPQSTTEPREFIGDPIVVEDIPVDATGAFSVDLGTLSVTGAANPITGADIVATLALQGSIQSTDLWCGQVTGAVTQPLEADLAGSTFAGVRLTGTDPASLPTDVVYACPAAAEGG